MSADLILELSPSMRSYRGSVVQWQNSQADQSRDPICGDLLPYLTLPPGWASSYACPALRLYQFGPIRVPECNHKVTGNGYEVVDGCEALNRLCKAIVSCEAKTSTKALVTCSKSALTSLVSS